MGRVKELKLLNKIAESEATDAKSHKLRSIWAAPPKVVASSGRHHEINRTDESTILSLQEKLKRDLAHAAKRKTLVSLDTANEPGAPAPAQVDARRRLINR